MKDTKWYVLGAAIFIAIVWVFYLVGSTFPIENDPTLVKVMASGFLLTGVTVMAVGLVIAVAAVVTDYLKNWIKG